MYMLFRFALCTFVLFYSSLTLAEGSEDGSDVQLLIGSMLPNQIDGVAEILPVFGGRYGYSLGGATLELGGFNSHAEGVDFTTVELSARGDVPVAPGIVGGIYAGADWNYYSGKDQTNRVSENGLHFGAAAMMLVSNTLWLRTDLKFMGGPGTSLYLLFGLMFKSSGQ